MLDSPIPRSPTGFFVDGDVPPHPPQAPSDYDSYSPIPSPSEQDESDPDSPLPDRKRGLTLGHVRHLANAVAFAAAPEREQNINSMLTVVWRFQAGWARGLRGAERDAWEAAEWPLRQRRLLDMTGRWLQRRDIEPVMAWGRERSPGRGAHSHIPLALPPDRAVELGDELRDYLAKAFRFHAEDSQPGVHVRHADDPADGDPWPVRYICRALTPGFRCVGGVCEDLHAALGLKPKDGGLIGVQRVGVSRSIDRTARHAAGWCEVRDFAGLRRLLHPNACF